MKETKKKKKTKVKIIYRTRPLPKPKLTWETMPDLLTTSEVMRALRVSKMQVYKLMKSGDIRATLISRADAKRVRYRFFKEDVAKLKSQKSSIN